MSRSIHTTWRGYWEKQRYQYVDRALQANELERIRVGLIRKRAIKKQKKAERKAPLLETLPPVATEFVPIEIQDQGAHVHYPLSESDVRAVLEVLPLGIADGLTSITFCLGAAYMKENYPDNPELEVDPYTGRIGSDEGTPSVFLPPVLGRYNYHTNGIFIHAYVYDNRSIHNIAVLEPYLKLKMLNTLLHELSHHEDKQRRMARGRWLGVYDTKAEDYAYKRQQELASKALVNLLYERYGPEIATLNSWIETHGGATISPRGFIKGGTFFTAAEVVDDLFRNVSEGRPADVVRHDFAKQLHYGGYNEQALSILDALLRENPGKLEIKALMADIYRHQQVYHLAESLATEVLLEASYNEASIFVLSEVYFVGERWSELIDVTREGLAHTSSKKNYRFLWYLEKQLLAHLFMGNYGMAENLLYSYPATRARESRHQAFQALLLLASGDNLEAQLLANRLLAGHNNKDTVVSAAAKCVFNISSSRLDHTTKTRKLSSKDQLILHNSKIGKLTFMNQ